MPGFSRRRMVTFACPVLVSVAFGAAARADLCPHPDPDRPETAASTGDVSAGTYAGVWSDGTVLRDILRVISPDLITLQREGYSTPPVPYSRTAQHQYRSARGNTLTVICPTQVQWVSSTGVAVTYSLR